MKLHTRLSIIIIAVVLVTIACLSALSYEIMKTTLQREITEKMSETARQSIDQIDKAMFERRGDIGLLADPNGPLLRADDYPISAQVEYLRAVEREYKMYGSMTIVAPNGTTIGDTRSTGIGRDESAKPYFIGALSGIMYSDPRPVYSQSLDIPVIHISAPLRDQNGTIQGVLVARVPVSKINSILNGMSIRQNTKPTIELLDRDGLVIFSTYRHEDILQKRLSGLTIYKKISASGADTETLVTERDGREVLQVAVKEQGYLDYPGQGWILILSVDTEVAFAPMYDLLQKTLLIAIVMLLLAIPISLYISKTIARPIHELHHGTEAIERGDLDVKVGTDAHDEIGQLSRSFDTMTAALKRSRQELEHKVDERTKELKEKLAELLKKEDEILRMNHDLEQANSKLQELDAKKDEFISVAAHELKTPLTSIQGFTQLLQDKRVMDDPEKRMHYLDMVGQNCGRLYNLVLDIVDSSRINLGQLKLNIEDVDPLTILSDIKENMELTIKENGITPAFSIDGHAPKIAADPERVMQVIRNLLINSVHFTPKGGTITLTIGAKGDAVQFEVRDTGQGIPKDRQASIFTKFYQADSSMTRTVKGSGLGLSICKGLVEAMGGRIWFESDEGKGTTFFFTIPVVKQDTR